MINRWVKDVRGEIWCLLVLRHFWGNPICKTPLSMDYASLFEGINIQCYKMELKKM